MSRREKYTVKNFDKIRELSLQDIKDFNMKMLGKELELEKIIGFDMKTGKETRIGGNSDVELLIIKKEFGLGLTEDEELTEEAERALKALKEIDLSEGLDTYQYAINNIKMLGAKGKLDVSIAPGKNTKPIVSEVVEEEEDETEEVEEKETDEKEETPSETNGKETPPETEKKPDEKKETPPETEKKPEVEKPKPDTNADDTLNIPSTINKTIQPKQTPTPSTPTLPTGDDEKPSPSNTPSETDEKKPEAEEPAPTTSTSNTITIIIVILFIIIAVAISVAIYLKTTHSSIFTLNVST